MINLFCFWNFLKNPAWSAVLALLLIISILFKIISWGLQKMRNFRNYRRVKNDILRRKNKPETELYIDMKNLRDKYFPYETDDRLRAIFKKLYKNKDKLGLTYDYHTQTFIYRGKFEG